MKKIFRIAVLACLSLVGVILAILFTPIGFFIKSYTAEQRILINPEGLTLDTNKVEIAGDSLMARFGTIHRGASFGEIYDLYQEHLNDSNHSESELEEWRYQK